MRKLSLSMFLVACLSSADSVEYTPQQDAAAMTAVTRVWSSASTKLSLCEDFVAEQMALADTCDYEHVVLGGGRGEPVTHDRGQVGCGGCPNANAAIVTGELDGRAVTGEIFLGADDDPYAYPYNVELRCVDPTNPCTFTGELAADGKLTNKATGEVLAPTGVASCPAPQ